MDELRSLDRDVATKVMGWRASDGKYGTFVLDDSEFGTWALCPPFSADSAEGWAAMKTVLERAIQLQTEQGEQCRWEVSGPTNGEWTAKLVSSWDRTDGLEIGEATAPSLPAAVCKAALAALEAADAPQS